METCNKCFQGLTDTGKTKIMFKVEGKIYTCETDKLKYFINKVCKINLTEFEKEGGG